MPTEERTMPPHTVFLSWSVTNQTGNLGNWDMAAFGWIRKRKKGLCLSFTNGATAAFTRAGWRFLHPPPWIGG